MSVYEDTADYMLTVVQDLALNNVADVTLCEDPFKDGEDIRPGAYLSPRKSVYGSKGTTDRDHVGYRFQCTVVRGSGSTRSDDMGDWMDWLEDIRRTFNNKRIDIDPCPTGTNRLPCKVEDVDVPNDRLRDSGYDAVAIMVIVWYLEPRT